MFVILWYNDGNKKSTSGQSLRLSGGGEKYGIWTATTILTVYGFGLRGNSAYKSIRKHRFRTQKPEKPCKSRKNSVF